MKLSDAVYGTLLEKDYEKALSLGNRYSFLNANLFPMLTKEEMDMMMGFQEVYKKLLPDALANLDDVYPLFPKLGDENMIQRMNPWNDIKGSCRHQLLLGLCAPAFAPEVDMAVTASGILVGNSLFHNPQRSDFQEQALGDIYSGRKVGGIGITEPEHGSDSVNMRCVGKVNEDGTITYNGTKIYTTNGAVADLFSTYGVTDITDPGHSMLLTLFTREDEGLTTERLAIPTARGVGIAKVMYNNVTVPADRLIAPPGEGKKRLFRGLTPERCAIIGDAIGGCWSALAHGIIYSQLRNQFGKPIFAYQGISHVLGDLYSRTAAYTSFAFQIADFYDKKIGSKIQAGEKPNAMDEGSVAVMVAQGKYLVAKFVHELCYEVVQTMGGRGAISEDGSNNGIARGENISRISEVMGGHRNIQLMIVEAGMKATTAMALSSFLDKAKKDAQKDDAKMAQLMLEKADRMLTSEEDAANMGDAKEPLEQVVSKLKAAIENKNKVEMEAYGKAIGKALGAAGKAIYKATKGVDDKDD